LYQTGNPRCGIGSNTFSYSEPGALSELSELITSPKMPRNTASFCIDSFSESVRWTAICAISFSDIGVSSFEFGFRRLPLLAIRRWGWGKYPGAARGVLPGTQLLWIFEALPLVVLGIYSASSRYVLASCQSLRPEHLVCLQQVRWLFLMASFNNPNCVSRYNTSSLVRNQQGKWISYQTNLLV